MERPCDQESVRSVLSYADFLPLILKDLCEGITDPLFVIDNQ
jgi:hypothetical protein